MHELVCAGERGVILGFGWFSDWNAAHDAANEHLGEAVIGWQMKQTCSNGLTVLGGEAMNTDERFDLLSSVDWSIRSG